MSHPKSLFVITKSLIIKHFECVESLVNLPSIIGEDLYTDYIDKCEKDSSLDVSNMEFLRIQTLFVTQYCSEVIDSLSFPNIKLDFTILNETPPTESSSRYSRRFAAHNEMSRVSGWYEFTRVVVTCLTVLDLSTVVMSSQQALDLLTPGEGIRDMRLPTVTHCYTEVFIGCLTARCRTTGHGFGKNLRKIQLTNLVINRKSINCLLQLKLLNRMGMFGCKMQDSTESVLAANGWTKALTSASNIFFPNVKVNGWAKMWIENLLTKNRDLETLSSPSHLSSKEHVVYLKKE